MEKNSLDIPLYVDMEVCDPSWATKKELAVKEDLTVNKEYDIMKDIDWD